MNITKNDIRILRELGQQKADIATNTLQNENIGLWTNTNDLKMSKPPIYINEIPWHEMNIDNELTLQCDSPFSRNLELDLRHEIYSWKHMPGNMVVSSVMECPLVINDSGFGISEDVNIVNTDITSDVVSRHFNVQIQDEDDIQKIKDPIVSLNQEKTEENYNLMLEIFDGIIEVKKTGVKGYWFTPWDFLIRLTGITEVMIDLYDRPEYLEKLVDRFVDASIVRLEQYNKLGVWASNNDSTRVGSGGYGYCSELDSADKLREHAPLKQLWGCGNAQIFSEVSPDMHWNFSLKQELRWLEHFGLNYYGCCEALHKKLNILEKIPNLRKISMSPWSKLEEVNEFAKNKYVLSCKPNPAIFAVDSWDYKQGKTDILNILKKTEGTSIEIIMKDISTVKYQPQRLWEWSKIAMDTITEYYR